MELYGNENYDILHQAGDRPVLPGRRVDEAEGSEGRSPGPRRQSQGPPRDAPQGRPRDREGGRGVLLPQLLTSFAERTATPSGPPPAPTIQSDDPVLQYPIGPSSPRAIFVGTSYRDRLRRCRPHQEDPRPRGSRSPPLPDPQEIQDGLAAGPSARRKSPPSPTKSSAAGSSTSLPRSSRRWKPQAAFFEEAGPAGTVALWRVTQYARAPGLIVIMDAKRGDIGTTAEGYARAYLAGADVAAAPWGADALTVNAYLGPDTLEPFVKVAKRARGRDLRPRPHEQPRLGRLSVRPGDAVPIYRSVAELVETLAARTSAPSGRWSGDLSRKNSSSSAA